MRISDWSSDVCSSDLVFGRRSRRALGRVASAGRHHRAVWLQQPAVPCVDCLPRQSRGVDAGYFGRKPDPWDAGAADGGIPVITGRSEEHTSELQSLMRISYAVFCLKKKTNTRNII